MYGCESWTIKKAEYRRIDAFELWCWRRLLRVPWTARRSNQSILKENSPGCSLERLMLELKLQYFGHLMWRADSLEKTLMLGKIDGRRRRVWQEDEMIGWHHWLNGHGFGWTTGVGDGQGGLVCCSSRGCRVGHNWATVLNWTEYGENQTMAFYILGKNVTTCALSVSVLVRTSYCITLESRKHEVHCCLWGYWTGIKREWTSNVCGNKSTQISKIEDVSLSEERFYQKKKKREL